MARDRDPSRKTDLAKLRSPGIEGANRRLRVGVGAGNEPARDEDGCRVPVKPTSPRRERADSRLLRGVARRRCSEFPHPAHMDKGGHVEPCNQRNEQQQPSAKHAIRNLTWTRKPRQSCGPQRRICSQTARARPSPRQSCIRIHFITITEQRRAARTHRTQSTPYAPLLVDVVCPKHSAWPDVGGSEAT